MRVYFSHLDQELASARTVITPQTLAHFRALLVLHALLYEQIVVADALLLHSTFIRNMLLSQSLDRFNYRGLFQAGIVVPARRDVTPNFVDLEAYLRRSGTPRHRLLPDPQQFAEFLEGISADGPTYGHDELSSSYTCRALDLIAGIRSGAIADLGLHADVIQDVTHGDRAKNEGSMRRMFLYHAAQVLQRGGRSGAARRLRQIATVMYHQQLAAALEIPAAMPAALGGSLARSGLVTGPPASLSAAKSDLLSIDASLTASALQLLTFEDIIAIRGTRAFKDYISTACQALEDPDAMAAASRMRSALARYLPELHHMVGLALLGRLPSFHRVSSAIRILRYASPTGSVGLSLIGIVAPEATLAGILWSLVLWEVDRRLARAHMAIRAEAYGAALSQEAGNRMQLQLASSHDATRVELLLP